MPHKTGASHVLAGLVAIVSTSYLNDLLQRLVSTRELLIYTNAATQRAIERFGVAVSPDLLPAIASATLISVLIFVWGWAYHRRVIDTVGYNYVKIFDTPGCRNPSRDSSRQYD